MAYPAGYKYTKDHEWIEITGDRGKVGITDYAQQQLGDVVFMELPEVGATLEAGALALDAGALRLDAAQLVTAGVGDDRIAVDGMLSGVGAALRLGGEKAAVKA